MKKTVLITGASRGIGRSTSQLLSERGFHVVGVARKKIDAFPGDLFACDLSDVDETDELLETIKGRYSIDAIVNNVGVAHPEPLGSISLANLYECYELNVRSAVQITQSLIEGMKERKWGRIVNIASRAILGVRDRTSYAAAKSALIGCTRTWAIELASFGITVNAVAPGATETELFRQKHKAGSEEEKHVLASIPLGRIGKPKEIAATIAFFLSEDAAFITGQTLHVDGGGSLPH